MSKEARSECRTEYVAEQKYRMIVEIYGLAMEVAREGMNA